MKNKSKTQAIKEARNLVGKLYPFGGNWRFNSTLIDGGLETASNPTNHKDSLFERSQKLIDTANELMGNDEFVEYTGGSWTLYV